MNEKHIEEGLDHKNLREITIKYHSNHRKHTHKLISKSKKEQCNIIFMDKKLAIKTSAHKFREKLGFKQHDVILTKEQSMLTKIMSNLKKKVCKDDIML